MRKFLSLTVCQIHLKKWPRPCLYLVTYLHTYLFKPLPNRKSRAARSLMATAAASTRVLVTFYFRLQISISGFSFFSGFFQPVNEFLWLFLKLGAMRCHLQFASLEIDLYTVYTCRGGGGCYAASSGVKGKKLVHSGTVPSLRRQSYYLLTKT